MGDPGWDGRAFDLLSRLAAGPVTPTEYPADSHRLQMATLTASEGESSEGRQLAVYLNDGAAAQAMGGFRRVLAACANTRSATGWVTKIRNVPVHLGDESLVIWEASFSGGRRVPSGGYSVVARDGRSVYLANVGGEYVPTGPTDRPAIDLVAVARGMLPLPQ